MIEKFSLGQFLRKFKNDDACLEHVFNLRFPQGAYCENCKQISKFYKIEGRPVYQCSCNFQISSLAGTIFEKSTTPLQYWFYAIFVMTMTRSGVSAKQLQRELGVTYKTAWRMMKQIRLLMANVDTNLLSGTVEVDESYFGGKTKRGTWGGGVENKEIVMGIVERKGKAYLKHIPDSSKYTLLTQIKEHVDPQARVITDQFKAYVGLNKLGFVHDSVNHQETYVVGDIYTQNIEGLWSILKRGIYGVYRVVSKKYLQAYIDEYAWRYNHRAHGSNMFDLLLAQVAEVKVVKAVK